MHSTTLLFSYLAASATAARFLLHIPHTASLNPATLPPSTHATLQSSGPPLSASISRANTFTFNNVSAGSYLASIHCLDYAFEALRIDISVEETVEGSGDQKEVIRAWQTFLGNPWENKGELRGEGGNGLVIPVNAVLKKEYYQERQGFSPLSFLKNPMILMALVSMVLIFGMPYLMENSKSFHPHVLSVLSWHVFFMDEANLFSVDPETRAEFESMQKQSGLGGNPADKIQNFDLAGLLAGKKDDGRAASPAAQGKKRG